MVPLSYRSACATRVFGRRDHTFFLYSAADLVKDVPAYRGQQNQHILPSSTVRRLSTMAVARHGDVEALPVYMVSGAMQRARTYLEEFGARPPRDRETLYTIRRLKKDFVDGLAWMREAFRHSPEHQMDTLGYYLYSRGVEEGCLEMPSKSQLELPWPLGDETCALDLLPKRLALQDEPPEKIRRCGRCGAALAAQ